MEDTQISLFKTKFGVITRTGAKRLHFVCDFVMTKTSDEILKHSQKHQVGWFKRNKLKPTVLMELDFTRACQKVLEKTYGIENQHHVEFGSKVITTRSE